MVVLWVLALKMVPLLFSNAHWQWKIERIVSC